MGVCRRTDTPVAIKLMQNFSKNDYECVKLLREIQLMKNLNKLEHEGGFRFIPELIDVIVPKDEDPADPKLIFLIQTHFGTDLRSVIEMAPELNLNENHLKTMMYNMLCALKFMHSANVVHRDIKPSNILVNERCEVRICDFGLARSLPQACFGESSGNTKRVRNAILQKKLRGEADETRLREQITANLENRRAQAKDKKRCLSNHIGTRWYRAPEVCLLEK